MGEACRLLEFQSGLRERINAADFLKAAVYIAFPNCFSTACAASSSAARSDVFVSRSSETSSWIDCCAIVVLTSLQYHGGDASRPPPTRFFESIDTFAIAGIIDDPRDLYTRVSDTPINNGDPVV